MSDGDLAVVTNEFLCNTCCAEDDRKILILVTQDATDSSDSWHFGMCAECLGRARDFLEKVT